MCYSPQQSPRSLLSPKNSEATLEAVPTGGTAEESAQELNLGSYDLTEEVWQEGD